MDDTKDFSTALKIPVPEKGSYTLVIFVPSEKRITIGKLGTKSFLRGYYAYTGSALGRGALGLRGRISRHLKKNKKKMWHIDFLLAEEDIKVISALTSSTSEKMECQINQYLQERMHAETLVPKFGSSDCIKGCNSHLLYFGCDDNVTEKLTEIYMEKNERGVCSKLHKR